MWKNEKYERAKREYQQLSDKAKRLISEHKRVDCMELWTERMDRLGLNYNQLDELEDGYLYNTNKKNNLSRVRAFFVPNPSTMLAQCFICKKTSTPKKVNLRVDCYNWDGSDDESHWILCCGCWNKVRPLVDKKWKANETNSLINKLYNEVLKCEKRKKQAI